MKRFLPVVLAFVSLAFTQAGDVTLSGDRYFKVGDVYSFYGWPDVAIAKMNQTLAGMKNSAKQTDRDAYAVFSEMNRLGLSRLPVVLLRSDTKTISRVFIDPADFERYFAASSAGSLVNSRKKMRITLTAEKIRLGKQDWFRARKIIRVTTLNGTTYVDK